MFMVQLSNIYINLLKYLPRENFRLIGHLVIKVPAAWTDYVLLLPRAVRATGDSSAQGGGLAAAEQQL